MNQIKCPNCGKEFTVDAIHVLEIVNGCDNVNAYRKLASDLHAPPPHVFYQLMVVMYHITT